METSEKVSSTTFNETFTPSSLPLRAGQGKDYMYWTGIVFLAAASEKLHLLCFSYNTTS